MRYKEMYKTKFYVILGKYPDAGVLMAINKLNKLELLLLKNYWAKDSKRSINNKNAEVVMEKIIYILENEIYKKSLFKRLYSFNKQQILRALAKLPSSHKISLLKEYSTEGYCLKEPLTDEERELNEKTIKSIERTLSINTKRLPHKSLESELKEPLYLIKLAVILLPSELIKMIVKQYGDNLDRLSNNDVLSGKERNDVKTRGMYNIRLNLTILKLIPSNQLNKIINFASISKISELLSNKELMEELQKLANVYKWKKTLEEIYGISIYTMMPIVNNILNEEEREVFQKEYNYHGRALIKIMSKSEIEQNERNIRLINIAIENYKKYKNFYKFMPSVPKNVKNSWLNYLADDEIEFLKEMYPKGLSYYPDCKMIIEEENIKKLESIIIKLNIIINRLNPRCVIRIIDVFPGCTIEEIEELAESFQLKKYLQSLFGYTLTDRAHLLVSEINMIMNLDSVVQMNEIIKDRKKSSALNLKITL